MLAHGNSAPTMWSTGLIALTFAYHVMGAIPRVEVSLRGLSRLVIPNEEGENVDEGWNELSSRRSVWSQTRGTRRAR